MWRRAIIDASAARKRREANSHAKQTVLNTCNPQSTLSSHAFPFNPTVVSPAASIWSDLVHTTTMGMPRGLRVSVPGPSGRRALVDGL